MNDVLSRSPNPDRPALIRVGKLVRARLAADPSVHRIPTDLAEIWGVTGFLSPDECTRMIAMIDQVAKPSSLFETTYQAGYRTSYSGDVDRSDPFVRMIERRIDDLLGMPNAFGETVQGQRYLPGQEFKQHNDWFYTKQPYWKAEKRGGGQRSFTAMAYLNPVDEGGETHFTKIGLAIPPQQGTLIIWNNTLENGTPNEFTMHAGTPVVRGVKYVITKWYRTRKWG
jgi:prolyl 4-hydroxylase